MVFLKEPAVSRRSLLRTAGVLWALVGVYLAIRAFYWFFESGGNVYLLAGIALLVGIAKSHLVLNRIVTRNIERIFSLSPHKEKICVFAFQAMHSYLIVLLMMAVGILLRHSHLSHNLLAVIYLAIGTALFLSGLRYFFARQL
jgi:hypothetical protein